ncbi:MAG: TatD DNase family protein, partial [Tenuifilum sp.]
MKLINFHTHNSQCKTNSICIESVDYNAHFKPNGNSFYTLGIHPWSSENANAIQSLNLLKEHLNHPNVIGIGEI